MIYLNVCSYSETSKNKIICFNFLIENRSGFNKLIVIAVQIKINVWFLLNLFCFESLELTSYEKCSLPGTVKLFSGSSAFSWNWNLLQSFSIYLCHNSYVYMHAYIDLNFVRDIALTKLHTVSVWLAIRGPQFYFVVTCHHKKINIPLIYFLSIVI